MTAARRDAPCGRLVVNEDWCVALFDAVVGIEDRRVNDRPEPLTGGVRRIRRNERVDEDLIPVQHLRYRRVFECDPGFQPGPGQRPGLHDRRRGLDLVRGSGPSNACQPELSRSSRPSRFEMSSSWRSLLRRTAGRPPLRWNAGTPVCRVNILKNAPENGADSVRTRRVETVRYCRHRKGLGRHRSPGAVTELLRAWGDGDDGALEQLTPLVEAELRRLARGYMRRERRGHTLQTTALVNEAFLRLTDARRVRWQDRAHFLGISARLMRRVLVDHARSRGYRKRGGGAERVTLDEGLVDVAGTSRGRAGAGSRLGGIGGG